MCTSSWCLQDPWVTKLPSFGTTRPSEASFFLCHRLTCLESLGELHTLTRLNLWTCEAITRLPCSLGQLRSLQKLYISECHALQDIPDCIGQLCLLWFVQIKRCNSLTSLPESLGQLQMLWMLNIENCAAFQRLPVSLCNAQQLEHIIVRACNAMVFPPASVTCLGTQEILAYCQRRHQLSHLFLLILSARRCNLHAHLPDELWTSVLTSSEAN